MNKIEKSHLERSAYLYVRQSTLAQVHNNRESQRRQYALAERAERLGWDEVHIIDEDLGRSGSGHVQRGGFERLLAKVCQGQVGAVFAIEASRLARNGQQWHRLLEFCAIVGTLIVDQDGIYDPKHPNDRLLLGLKGTLSEMEVSTLRQRSEEAIRQKARRGEYYAYIPVGYVPLGEGRLEKDPDEQVRRSIELVFTKFRELGSARQVFLWFRQEDIKIPRRRGHVSGHIEYVPAAPWTIGSLLKDPTYAGVYAHGRTKRRVTLENGRKRVFREKRSRPEDWDVYLPEHHDSYLSWQEYQQNQETLAHNRNQLGELVRGSARQGKGLLAGLVRCGQCGRKMRVRYGGRHGRNSAVVYYLCFRSQAQQEEIGKQICRVFGGVTVERAVVEAVLDGLSPIRMQVLAEATQRLTEKRTEKVKQLQLELERARYEADRYQRQYHSVEPENRLVARTLESRWNRALERVSALEMELSRLGNGPEAISAEEQADLSSLAADLRFLWDHPAAAFDLKKRIVRAVVKEIVVYVDQGKLRVLVHWQGGQHTEMNLRKRKTGEHRWKTCDSTLELVRQLARLMSDKQIAAQLNRMGIQSAKGHSWTRTRVGNFRQVNSIANYVPGERELRGEMTLEEAAERLGVSYSTVQRLIQRNQLPAQQVCPGAPWIVRKEDVDTLRCNSRGRNSPSSPSSNQQSPQFTEDI
jgi:excisionase family DNA binding protein